MIERILVAFDGSEHSERALNTALDIAQQYSAETELLAVVPPLFIPMYSLTVTTSEVIKEANRQLQDIFMSTLYKAEEKVKHKHPKLKFSAKLEHGRPDEIIVETAKNGRFDLIVIGSRGIGRREFALGSVSSKVVELASCPVLVVK